VTDRISEERVRSCLNLVQSTSPSWLILGSLDLARMELAISGRNKLDLVVRNVDGLRRTMADLGWPIWYPPAGMDFYQDPLKINLVSSRNGYSGAELARALQQNGVYPEMVHQDGVLLMFGLGDVANRYQELIECLYTLPKREPLAETVWDPPPLPEMRLRPRTAYFAHSHSVELGQAVGKIAARPLYIYPPGAPLVYPGELLDSDVVSVARRVLRSGGQLVGCRGGRIMVVK
jgi:arginine decarboxylase